MQKTALFLLTLPLFLGLFLKACSKVTTEPEKITLETAEINQLVTDVFPSAAESEIVTLLIFGGPLSSYPLEKTTIPNELNPSSKLNLINFLSLGKIYLVQQAQTLPTAYRGYDPFSELWSSKKAAEVLKDTLLLTQRVITHFKSQGKKVIVVGISYGGFLVNELLQAPLTADAYVSSHARLRFPQSIIDFVETNAYQPSFLGPSYTSFEAPSEVAVRRAKYEEKRTAAAEELSRMRPTKTYSTAQLDVQMTNLATLAVASGGKNFLELLKNKDLSKALFVHATRDKDVGDLTAEERTFMTANAQLSYYGGSDPPEQHGVMGLVPAHRTAISNFLRKKLQLK